MSLSISFYNRVKPQLTKLVILILAGSMFLQPLPAASGQEVAQSVPAIAIPEVSVAEVQNEQAHEAAIQLSEKTKNLRPSEESPLEETKAKTKVSIQSDLFDENDPLLTDLLNNPDQFDLDAFNRAIDEKYKQINQKQKQDHSEKTWLQSIQQFAELDLDCGGQRPEDREVTTNIHTIEFDDDGNLISEFNSTRTDKYHGYFDDEGNLMTDLEYGIYWTRIDTTVDRYDPSDINIGEPPNTERQWEINSHIYTEYADWDDSTIEFYDETRDEIRTFRSADPVDPIVMKIEINYQKTIDDTGTGENEKVTTEVFKHDDWDHYYSKQVTEWQKENGLLLKELFTEDENADRAFEWVMSETDDPDWGTKKSILSSIEDMETHITLNDFLDPAIPDVDIQTGSENRFLSREDLFDTNRDGDYDDPEDIKFLLSQSDEYEDWSHEKISSTPPWTDHQENLYNETRFYEECPSAGPSCSYLKSHSISDEKNHYITDANVGGIVSGQYTLEESWDNIDENVQIDLNPGGQGWLFEVDLLKTFGTRTTTRDYYAKTKNVEESVIRLAALAGGGNPVFWKVYDGYSYKEYDQSGGFDALKAESYRQDGWFPTLLGTPLKAYSLLYVERAEDLLIDAYKNWNQTGSPDANHYDVYDWINGGWILIQSGTW